MFHPPLIMKKMYPVPTLQVMLSDAEKSEILTHLSLIESVLKRVISNDNDTV